MRALVFHLILLTMAVVAVGLEAAVVFPRFEAVQSDLLSGGGTLVNAWADFDKDDDLDLFVGFNTSPGGSAPQPSSAPAPRLLAIRNVTVIPVTGGPSLQAATVLVRDDRIAAIGPAAETDVPPGARIVDGTGKFLLPGFIEMHAHLSKARASALGLFVVNGVTTLRDVGGDHEELLRWRREVRGGTRVGPRILMAGPYLESQRNIERMRKDPPEERVEPFERARIGVGPPEEARRVVASPCPESVVGGGASENGPSVDWRIGR